jgi:hypothetical protein
LAVWGKELAKLAKIESSRKYIKGSDRLNIRRKIKCRIKNRKNKRVY